ncbi:MAG: DsbA family oxidoreductase [Alphaproteobacteria bacterium]|nr:DsbA family oxidoreductase [Alphaproteobacteria bacterium]MDE2337003.1 DsbA family oxidoreductase [Alphaproteobacteria bacterium]
MTLKKGNDSLMIEVTSDFVCPWCFIGEARLAQALKSVAPPVAVEYRWRPYELNPGKPKAGVDRAEYMAKKFGAARAKEMDAHMKELGAEAGVVFRHDLIKRSPNTRQAHRLNWWAAQEGKNIAPLIFKAYFSDGKNIGDDAALVKIAAEAGLDAEKARAFLASDQGTAAVVKLEEQARAQGVDSVPFITIDGEEIRGAETVEVMVEVLRRVLGKRGRTARGAA